MQDKVNQDLKQAMLSGDKHKAETLKLLKSAMQNASIEQGVQDKGLSDEEALRVLAREAKSRADTAKVYEGAGETDRAAKELAEKAVIEAYLPEQMDESELAGLVEKCISALGASGVADMGKVIGAVKAEAGASADGAMVARLAKEKLAG